MPTTLDELKQRNAAARSLLAQAQAIDGSISYLRVTNWADDSTWKFYQSDNDEVTSGALDTMKAAFVEADVPFEVLASSKMGMLFDHYTDGASTSTNGTEDDLYSDTVPASALADVGYKIFAQYCCIIVGSATATRRIRAYFGGAAVLDSGTLTFASGGTVEIWITLIRINGTDVRVVAEFVPSGITLQPIVTYTIVTVADITASQVLKITGVATGAGAAGGDIVAKIGTVEWKAAA